MKIIVTVKQVPDTTGKVSVKPDGTLDRASMETVTNPDDLNAVEAALQLKDQYGARVITVTMGPMQAESMLRELYAMGVDECVLVSGREFGGSDTYATSQIIAAAIDTIGLDEDDIILAGRQAIDGDTAQVGPELAEHLGLPQVTYGIEVEVEDGLVKVKREAEVGYTIIGVQTPCVVTMTQTFYEPRYPTIKTKMAAKRAKIANITAGDLAGIDTSRCGLKGSPTKVKKTFVPVRNKDGMIIDEGSTEASSVKLVSLLSSASII